MNRKETNPFYLTKAWQKKRALILKRDGYIDQLEKRAGKIVSADTVHHIFPIERYPEYKLANWNLISVSRETHEELHNRMTGELSREGISLLRETAKVHDIEFGTITLICGMPGTGKATWAKRNMGEGLCYDLDYIAAAFRLEQKTTTHEGARRMANALALSFAENANLYTSKVFIIRTAPSIEEVYEINPDRVILMRGKGKKKFGPAKTGIIKERLEEIEGFCLANNIPVESPPSFFVSEI